MWRLDRLHVRVIVDRMANHHPYHLLSFGEQAASILRAGSEVRRPSSPPDGYFEAAGMPCARYGPVISIGDRAVKLSGWSMARYRFARLCEASLSS